VFDTSSDSTAARRSGRRGLKAAAAAAVAAVALAACTPAQAGAAAVIGDRRISTSEVSQATQGIKQGNPQLAQGKGLDRTVLFFLVISPYVLSAAEQNGVGVSADTARQMLPNAQDPDPGAVRVLRTFVALQQLQQAGKNDALTQIQKDVTAAKPELNPRYGTFDVKQMAVVDAPPNWIVPSAEPTASSGDTP
jgi:peptidyl-prolyl cis-trans isomerase SurA